MKKPKKSLGQNFLIDQNINKKIINQTNIKNENIVEIGPGLGQLTDFIITKKPKSLILINGLYCCFADNGSDQPASCNCRVKSNDFA